MPGQPAGDLMRTLKKLFTAEELLHLPTDGPRLELVKGKVYEMPPAGGRHGKVAMNIGTLLNAYVRPADLGHVFAAESGFILRRDPDTVRAPDAAFVASGRLTLDEIPEGYVEIAPDLVVEVVSPGDSRREVREKAEDWLRYGVRLVWVINPATHSAAVYRSLDNVSELSEDDTLDGEDVVPGFACQLRDVFG
jgi:Uma2 family endonuclease